MPNGRLIRLLQSLFSGSLQLGRSAGIQGGTIVLNSFLAMLFHIEDPAEIDVGPTADLNIAGGRSGAFKIALRVLQFTAGDGNTCQHEQGPALILMILDSLLRVILGAIEVAAVERTLGEINEQLLTPIAANQFRRAALRNGTVEANFSCLVTSISCSQSA